MDASTGAGKSLTITFYIAQFAQLCWISINMVKEMFLKQFAL